MQVQHILNQVIFFRSLTEIFYIFEINWLIPSLISFLNFYLNYTKNVKLAFINEDNELWNTFLNFYNRR